MTKSCKGCKFLYGNGTGYSNYTWMETYAECALDKNPNLLNYAELPYDYENQDVDEWEPTKNSRCESYSPGVFIILDPDRNEVVISEESDDEEQIKAISEHDRN